MFLRSVSKLELLLLLPRVEENKLGSQLADAYLLKKKG